MQDSTATRACGLTRRLLAIVYDALIVVALWFVAGVAALPLTDAGPLAMRSLPYTLYLALVWFGYVAWCWTHGGQTLGLRAWRARIVATDGGPVTWRASAVRFISSLGAFLALGAGFWLALWHPARATWQDRASDTRLVRVEAGSDRFTQQQDDGGHQQQ